MNFITAIRKGKGLTQAQFAAALEISPGHVGDIERGARKPSIKLAVRMEEILQVPGIVAAVVAEKTGDAERAA